MFVVEDVEFDFDCVRWWVGITRWGMSVMAKDQILRRSSVGREGKRSKLESVGGG